MELKCSILKPNKINIRNMVKAFYALGGDEKAIKTFIRDAKFPKIDRRLRLNINELDSQKDIDAFVKDYIKFFNEIILDLANKLEQNSKSIAPLFNLTEAVYGDLFIELDTHVKNRFISNDLEDKTQDDIIDKNRLKLDEHFRELYGVGTVVNAVKSYFEDNIVSAAFYDFSTGIPVPRNNVVLNDRIQDFKNLQYKYIVEYLQSVGELGEDASTTMVDEDGNFDGFEYWNTLNKFYRYFSTHKETDPETNALLTSSEMVIKENQNRLNNSITKEKESMFAQLVQRIQSGNPMKYRKAEDGFTLTDAEVKEKLADIINRLKGLWSIAAYKRSSKLYQAGALSLYYNTYKKYLLKEKLENIEVEVKTKNGKKVMTAKEIFDFIETEKTGILPAARAYTILTHFDALLKDSKAFIDFKNSYDGVPYIPNKYLYHQDTAHQKKSWQTSEDMSSEKATANITKNMFERIIIYDYKTDQYTDKHLDITKFVVATHNLIDDIIYGRIVFQGDNGKLTKGKTSIPNCAKEFVDCLQDSHGNTTRKFMRALELLFNNGEFSLIKRIQDAPGYRRLLTNQDINVLYSLYNVVYNPNNPASLISSEMANAEDSTDAALSIVGEISGYIDRNSPVHYLETSIDYSTGIPTLSVKRKYSNTLQVSKLTKDINNIQRKSRKEVEELQELCNLTYPTDNVANIPYTVTLGEKGNEDVYEIEAPKIGLRILNSSGLSVSSKTRDILKELEKVDLIELRRKLQTGLTLSVLEQRLGALLNFIEKATGIKLLTNSDFNLLVLQIFKETYNAEGEGFTGRQARSENYSAYLEPLLMLATRAAYVNKRMLEMHQHNDSLARKGQPLHNMKEYLNSLSIRDDDGIYRAFLANAKTSTAFVEKYGDVKYRIVSTTEGFLDEWTNSRAMLTGEASKATTKDRQGNSIPNNSINKLGNMLRYYLNKQGRERNSNVKNLMFVKDPKLIKAMYQDYEITPFSGESKSIRNYSQGELFFHSMFNKFWAHYLNKGNIIVQPTVYSDKTTFLNWEIGTTILSDNSDIMMVNNPEIYEEAVINKYGDTIGEMYRNVWASTEEKLNKIRDLYNERNSTAFSYEEVLRHLTEDQLISMATELGIELELDKDYRRVGKDDNNNYCVYNEMLKYNATVLYAKTNGSYENLANFLKNQRSIFVNNLLNSNSSYLVIDYNDDYGNYLKPDAISTKSKNTVLNIILKYFDKGSDTGETKNARRAEFFKNWVDAKTGKLIIAKTIDGKNIIGVGDNYDGEQVELNPFLNKFFYIEGLMSNNLRMSLTGSEINHPDKAKGTPLDVIKGIDVTSEKEIKAFAKDLGLKSISADVVEGLKNFFNGKDDKIKVKTIHDLDLKKDIPASIAQYVELIKNKTMERIINTAQGTLFKRNVIIPATLQYCRQNVFNGILPRLTCCVIRDDQADVFNYRGDKEGTIDACDGSARITPFQSILENKCLDSQAVGFTKKPIWHAYDSNGGTAFLAKFATNTITNAEMKNSASPNLFRLFKKMTNVQWDPSENISLVQTVGLAKNATTGKRREWFQTKILGNAIVNGEPVGNNELLYTDSYGNIIKIHQLKAENTSAGTIYYTEELDAREKEQIVDKDGNKIATPMKKVYHLFYDKVDENDKIIEKSVHKTFDTAEKAKKFLQDDKYTHVHTINSLYELHTALGGINCCNRKGESSEFVNEVVVNYMNNICSFAPKKDENGKDMFDPETGEQLYHTNKELKDLETFYQPLKKYHVAYAFNNSSVKNGAKNINTAETWLNDNDLHTFEVDSDGLGMQMNADHDIINSELTEFSQVITATSAYGYTFDNCNETFMSLGMAAFQASYAALSATHRLLDAAFETEAERQLALSDLYDAVGRIIMTNESIKDKESLQHIIMQAVQNIFFNSKNHFNDQEKIPFSDANIYSQFIATLASTINKESIKRKHPGSGSVLVPAFNTIMYYEVGGNKMMAQDVLKEARKEYKQEIINVLKNPKYNYDEEANSITIRGKDYILDGISLKLLEELVLSNKIPVVSKYFAALNGIDDVTDRNRALVRAYLEGKQEQVEQRDDNSYFMPTDIVDIMYDDGKIETVELNSMKGYYDFKFGIPEAMKDYNVDIESDYDNMTFDIYLKDEEGNRISIVGSNGELNYQSFRISPDFFYKGGRKIYTGKYNIHFRTGVYDEVTQRRIKTGIDTLPVDWKDRLFKATLRILPVGSTLRLSDSTAQQIETGLGGLNKGSVHGYMSILERMGDAMVEAGDAYNVQYYSEEVLGFVPILVTEYKKIGNTPRHKYRENVTRGHNLRPSIVRWQEKDANGNLVYKNIFDTEVIRDAYIKPLQEKHKNSRKDIQDLLHSLEKGSYTENGVTKEIYNFENYAAELIMSNLYKDVFDIGNESLYDILQQGEDYFIKKNGRTLAHPSTPLYDLAFIKDTGQSTLISFNKVNTTSNGSVMENDFDLRQLTTNDKDEIYLLEHNRMTLKVGKWINDDSVTFKDGKFFKGTEEVDKKDYRINKEGAVQKRLMFIKRFAITLQDTKKDRVDYTRHTLYEIADAKVFEEALKDSPIQGETMAESISKQRAKLILNMFGNSKAAFVNSAKTWTVKDGNSSINTIDSAVLFIRTNNYISLDVKDLLDAQIDSIKANLVEKINYKKASKEEKKIYDELAKKQRLSNLGVWDKAVEDFQRKDAHKKWVSFQESLKFIASRIPAQTLQSFMSMKLVAWTQNSKNMAYVSHFQTYLQGSDYDIDKAYIMGQSFDEQSHYIGWSNLFDYYSQRTLEASKELPIPKGRMWDEYGEDSEIKLDNTDNDENVDKYLEIMAKGELTEDDRVNRIKYLAKIIKNAEKNDKKVKYNGADIDGVNALIDLINSHERTPLAPNIAEAAYKNVASANIYAVAHDIRNRDQAYTAITVKTLSKAADKSPKGKQASTLNMLNPLTKYVMQYQNLVGKDVIAIAANGEKVWFTAYYHWHKILESGDEEKIQRLKFQQTFNRINGRAKGEVTSKTVSYLPDLDVRNQLIRNSLEEYFGVNPNSEEYVYVDQLISQLLSAATDNAKELILDKITAGTNFARMYVYAIINGYNINDIVAFMTSGVASFIDKMAPANVFQQDSVYNKPNTAISLATGYVNPNKYLHGSVERSDPYDPEGEKQYKKKSQVFLEKISNGILISKQDLDSIKQDKELYTALKVNDKGNITDLGNAVQCIIQYALKNNMDLDFMKLIGVDKDMEMFTYLSYLQSIFENLKSVKRQYEVHKDGEAEWEKANAELKAYREYRDDVKEFKKLYELSSELTQIAQAYLGLNQGLPTSELDIIKRLSNMTQLVNDRELALGLNVQIFPKKAELSGSTVEKDGWTTTYGEVRDVSDTLLEMNLEKVVDNLLENNPTLGDRESIKVRLRRAYDNNLIRGFNPTKYIIDPEYRKDVRDYYGLLMGTLNVFDMMEEIPTYKRNLECFRLLITSNGLAAKSRIINDLIYSKQYIKNDELANTITYVDKLLANAFVDTLPPVILSSDFEGLDEFFLPKTVTSIHLGSLNGLATFRKWVETDFFNDIKQRKGSNKAIKHLTKVALDDGEVLAMDIDMLSPNISIETALAYDEILLGMQELDDEEVKYGDTQYTVSDILQLYNIIVNNNKYGNERLTTAFKNCRNNNSIMKRYFDFVSSLDISDNEIYNYIRGKRRNELKPEELPKIIPDYRDFLIAIAPTISEYSERIHTEPFVKVLDDQGGYTIKEYIPGNNIYKEYPYLPKVPGETKLTDAARKNFAEYSPSLLVNSHIKLSKTKFLDFESIHGVSDADELYETNPKAYEEIIDSLILTLSSYSISGQIRIYKEC